MSKEKPGPTSAEGKRIASQNAAKHYMTGRMLLIKGEEQADLDALLAQWQADYPTDTVEAAKLVQDAAISEWILLRVQRQSDIILLDLFQLGMDAWQDGDHKRYQLTQRYLTAAERKVERNRRVIWQYRREMRAQDRQPPETRRMAACAGGGETVCQTEPEPVSPPKQESDMPTRQFAFVSLKDGRTVTDLQPPNESVLRGLGLRAEESLVKRDIRFECDEIPAEYAFCMAELAKIDAPLKEKMFRVHHTLRSFATAVEREASAGGHVQEWPDLYEQNKQFIQEALDKKCRQNE